MTLKEKIQTARLALGVQKANSIIAGIKVPGDRGPTLAMQCDALEDALTEHFAQRAAAKPPVPIAQHSSPAPVAKSQASLELCAQYQALNSDEARRAFWQENQNALSGKISGLAAICMAAGIPLSFRARAGMNFSVAPTNAGPKMSWPKRK